MTANELRNKKITMATLKAFIRKHDVLLAETESSFDGMTDMVEKNRCKKLVPVSKEDAIGIKGVWCVGSSRDHLTFIESGGYYGINVFNCCGSSNLWTPKQ